jgi:hypothetical protein
MRLVLHLHPDSSCSAVAGIEVEVARPERGKLALSYVVTGEIAELLIPPPDAPARSDGLWQHSCFEAFVRAADEAAYYEFNLAPSLHWAAYRFDSYRSGMRPAAELDPPGIEGRFDAGRYKLHALLDLDRVVGLPPDAVWQIGLSAVIEEKSGGKSHWALAHPPGKADFHHPDSFALELAGPSGA